MATNTTNGTRTITDELVDDEFGVEWKNICDQAILLIQGGNFDLMTMDVTNVGSSIDNNTRELVLIHCSCYGSECDMDHMVHLCFVDSASGNGLFLISPFSLCGCKDGDLFCSHQLGLLLALSLVQWWLELSPGISESDFLKMMLEHPCVLQGLLILIKWLVWATKYKSSKAATKREQ
jgi:hypothetical protein